MNPRKILAKDGIPENATREHILGRLSNIGDWELFRELVFNLNLKGYKISPLGTKARVLTNISKADVDQETLYSALCDLVSGETVEEITFDDEDDAFAQDEEDFSDFEEFDVENAVFACELIDMLEQGCVPSLIVEVARYLRKEFDYKINCKQPHRKIISRLRSIDDRSDLSIDDLREAMIETIDFEDDL